MLEGSDVRGSTPRAVSTVGVVRLTQGDRGSVPSRFGVQPEKPPHLRPQPSRMISPGALTRSRPPVAGQQR